MNPIAVVILAGGEGRRMGGNKPLRRLGGQTLIDCALDQARGWSPLVAVAVRRLGQLGQEGCQEILDDEGEGPLAGVAAALGFAAEQGANAVLTIPCDMPLLPADLAARLGEALVSGVDAAIATSGGDLHPDCGLWRTTARQALVAYRASGESSLRGFAAHLGCVTVDWPVAPYNPFLNLNRPEELAAAEAVLGKRLKRRGRRYVTLSSSLA